MAEIEFKRRGTPLWLVLVVLLALGGAGYFLFARRPAEPVATTADSTTVATAKLPTGDAQRAHLAQGVRLLAGALEQKAPAGNTQVLLLRAVADTLGMPDTQGRRLTDLTQLAFFAFSHAMGQQVQGADSLGTIASSLQLDTPLARQSAVVNRYFAAAADAAKKPASPAGAQAAPGAPATPAASAPAAGKSGS